MQFFYMDNQNIPHKYNSEFNMHPSYAITLMEEVAVDAFLNQIQSLQTTFNVDIKFVFNNNDGQVMKFKTWDMGTSYGFLPILLSLDTQKYFRQVFPKDEYPIGLFEDPSKKAQFKYVPTLKNSKHFAPLLSILSFSVEDYINKAFVKTLLPLHNNVPFFKIEGNEILQECLFEAIKKNNIKEVLIPVNDDCTKVYVMVQNALNGGEHQMEVPKDKFVPIEADLVSLYESVHKQYEERMGRVEDRLTIRISDEKEYMNFPKPEIPSKIRYDQYLKIEEKEERKRINSDDPSKGRGVYYGI